MIKHILDFLQLDEFYGVSKNIDIAKGYYEIPTTIKGAKKQIKRIIKSKTK